MLIALFVVFVVLSFVFHFAAKHVSRVRVLQEVAMPQESWDQIRQFWETVGRAL